MPRIGSLLALALRTCSVASLGAFGALVAATSLASVGAAAVEGGRAEIVAATRGGTEPSSTLLEGTPDTAFSLRIPEGASCSGDSTSDGFRVQSFMVPESIDPDSLTFGANGPVPPAVGDAFRQPLYMVSTKSFVNAATNVADRPGGPGTIINIPDFDLGVFEPGQLPEGRYRLGIACTKGPPSESQLDRYWATEIEVGSEAASAGWKATGGPLPGLSPGASTASSEPATAEPGPDAGAGSAGAPSRDVTDDRDATPPPVDENAAVTSGGGVAARDAPTPTGGPPTFHMPAVRIASSLSVAGSTTDSLVLWLVTAALTGRMALLLARRPLLAAPTRR